MNKCFYKNYACKKQIQAKKNLIPTKYDRDISIDFSKLWIKQ